MNLLRAGGPLIRVGHRGAAALAPENTLRSFDVALAHGVDAIEFDVLDLTGGPLVLAHSRAEVPDDRATLDDALDFLRGHDVGIHVDLKLTTRLDEVAAALDRHGLAERTVVSSFHLPSLRTIAAHAPALPRGFTYPEDRYGVSKRRALAPAVRLGTLALRRAIVRRVPAMIERAGAKALMLQHAIVSAAAVERAHRAGVAVWAWTVDDPVELARLDAAGVDAVITNDPALFAQGTGSAAADPVPREDP
jgi:glycerophosphoryl diester phosphodiesterase